MFYDELYVTLMAILPISELRGAIPLGVALGIPLNKTAVISILANLMIVPILLMSIEWVIGHVKKLSFLRQVVEKFESKTALKVNQYRTYRMLGLFLLVAIPLPGTGVYTACLAARIFKMKMMNAWLAISCGVIIAGGLVTMLTGGIIGFG